MALESIPAYSRLRGSSAGPVYNEAAFHYFLAADRSRAQRSPRSMVLVLVSLRLTPGRSDSFTDSLASTLFTALGACVREVDFVGWYRQDRVVGAVLPQGAVSSSELRSLVLNRIVTSLKKAMPADASRYLHVRVVRLGRKEKR